MADTMTMCCLYLFQIAQWLIVQVVLTYEFKASMTNPEPFLQIILNWAYSVKVSTNMRFLYWYFG